MNVMRYLSETFYNYIHKTYETKYNEQNNKQENKQNNKQENKQEIKQDKDINELENRFAKLKLDDTKHTNIEQKQTHYLNDTLNHDELKIKEIDITEYKQIEGVPDKVKTNIPRPNIPDQLKDDIWFKTNFDNHKGRCYCCNRTLYRDDIHIGHNLAHSLGGLTTLENLYAVCRPCNLMMGLMSIDEFKKTCSKYDNDGNLIYTPKGKQEPSDKLFTIYLLEQLKMADHQKDEGLRGLNKHKMNISQLHDICQRWCHLQNIKSVGKSQLGMYLAKHFDKNKDKKKTYYSIRVEDS